MVTFPAEERHRPLTSTKLYCSVTEAHRCEQLAQGCYTALSRWKLNPLPIDRKSYVLLLHRCATLTEETATVWVSKQLQFPRFGWSSRQPSTSQVSDAGNAEWWSTSEQTTRMVWQDHWLVQLHTALPETDRLATDRDKWRKTTLFNGTHHMGHEYRRTITCRFSDLTLFI